MLSSAVSSPRARRVGARLSSLAAPILLPLALAAGAFGCAGRPFVPRVGHVDGDTVVIGDGAPRVGAVAEMKKEQRTTMKIRSTPPDGPPRDVFVDVIESEHRREEILEVDGKHVHRLKVTFLERSKTTTANGSTKREPSPVVGKSYFVTNRGPNVSATSESGDAVTEAELAVIRDVYTPRETKGGDDGTGRPIRIGEPADAFARGFTQGLLSTLEGGKVDAVSATLRTVHDEPTGKCAVIAIDFAVHTAPNAQGATTAMKGQVELHLRVVDGFGTATLMDGDLIVASPHSAPPFMGVAKTIAKETTTYP